MTHSEAARHFADLAQPKVSPALDPDFRPNVLANRAFSAKVAETGAGVPLAIALDRMDGTCSRYDTAIFPDGHELAPLNLPYVERLVKFLLWQKGAPKVWIGGSDAVAAHIRSVYSPGGARAFDYEFMGETIYERPFEVVSCPIDAVPPARETSMAIGRHLEGCRIGFDLGASDRKVAAVIDGEAVYTEEVVWTPRDATDPQYHYDEIMAALKKAAEHMPRVDAIGGSSAGVILHNRPMVASLFRGVPKDLFETRIKNLFLDIGKAWGVPIEVANDGDVTALAGAMSLGENAVLGIAMGSSEAVGYVNGEGNITGWLNELAFAPIDVHPEAPADEWSGDVGCGVQYLTQQAVFRMAKKVGIQLDESALLAERLKAAQSLLEAGDERAEMIWATIGVEAGYAVAHYATFYDVEHVLVLGRVTSGRGGGIILDRAREVLRTEFPEMAARIRLNLPDEKTRRVGQAVAAASLPEIAG
ncbi:MAG: ROK family protein [Fimbriimonadaceae bacterium]